jgi:hypothetical protein
MGRQKMGRPKMCHQSPANIPGMTSRINARFDREGISPAAPAFNVGASSTGLNVRTFGSAK